MKKIILVNNEENYEARYIISKNRCVRYHYKKNTNYRYLAFYKNNKEHRNCNIGPQFKDIDLIIYIENGKTHNLYGYAIINKYDNGKKYYCINNEEYTKNQFLNYILIYNNLSYKRSYL